MRSQTKWNILNLYCITSYFSNADISFSNIHFLKIVFWYLYGAEDGFQIGTPPLALFKSCDYSRKY